MALGDKLNEQKKTPSTSISAKEEIALQVEQSKIGLESILLQQALMESKAQYEILSERLIASVEKGEETAPEIKQIATEIRQLTARLILENKKYSENIGQVVEKVMAEKFAASFEEAANLATTFNKNIIASTNTAKSELASLKYIISACLVVIMLLSGYSFYQVQELTNKQEDVTNRFFNTLKGDSKFWWDTENQKLYLDKRKP